MAVPYQKHRIDLGAGIIGHVLKYPTFYIELRHKTTGFFGSGRFMKITFDHFVFRASFPVEFGFMGLYQLDDPISRINCLIIQD
jgi:hypothetical protein